MLYIFNKLLRATNNLVFGALSNILLLLVCSRPASTLRRGATESCGAPTETPMCQTHHTVSCGVLVN